MQQKEGSECSTDIQRVHDVVTAVKGSPSSHRSHEVVRSKLTLISEVLQAVQVTMPPEDQREHTLGRLDHAVRAERASSRNIGS
jgi:hypothetical protein